MSYVEEYIDPIDTYILKTTKERGKDPKRVFETVKSKGKKEKVIKLKRTKKQSAKDDLEKQWASLPYSEKLAMLEFERLSKIEREKKQKTLLDEMEKKRMDIESRTGIREIKQEEKLQGLLKNAELLKEKNMNIPLKLIKEIEDLSFKLNRPLTTRELKQLQEGSEYSKSETIPSEAEGSIDNILDDIPRRLGMLRDEDIEGSGLPMKHKKLLHHILKTHTNPKEVGFILGLSKHKDNMGKTPIAKVNIILKALKRLEKRGIKIGDLMNEAEPQQKKSL